MEWSKGDMRFMATLRWVGTWMAELQCHGANGCAKSGREVCVSQIGCVPYYAVCAFADEVENLVVAACCERGEFVVHGGGYTVEEVSPRMP